MSDRQETKTWYYYPGAKMNQMKHLLEKESKKDC